MPLTKHSNGLSQRKQLHQENIDKLISKLQNESDYEGKLRVEVIQARNLNAEGSGSIEPFCKVKLLPEDKKLKKKLKQKFTTQVIKAVKK